MLQGFDAPTLIGPCYGKEVLHGFRYGKGIFAGEPGKDEDGPEISAVGASRNAHR